MSNIYSISLLNDLHNHFPDILYNPNRFRNVQDLLEYIRQVAQMNPFDRGLHMYRHVNQYDISNPSNIQFRVPITNSIITRIITGMMNDVDNLDNIVIQPTLEQIVSATTVYPVNTLQDDICIICQENIQSEEVRRITRCGHYFHRTCIDIWFQENVQCPTCRYDIRD